MKIAVIGGAGRMGRWLLEHFDEHGHTLIASDPQSNELREIAELFDLTLASSNAAAAKNADVVVISVPIEITAEVIQEVAPHMKRDAVLCEISSVKGKIPEVLHEIVALQLRPLSIHPMFGPGARSLNKKMVLVPISDPEDEQRLVEALFPKYQIITVDREEHDRAMALTVSLPYFVNMIIASVLSDEDLTSLRRLGGTTFAVQLLLTGSIMSNSCALHAALHKENPHVDSVLRNFQSKLESGLATLTQDTNDFRELYTNVKSNLEQHMNLENKYGEMYRLLEIMGRGTVSEGDS
ncbi:MAG: prephenate dehydrogenase/arogenate dehydrogenase family protein [Candidatus Thorarchaeota archaeon]